MQSKISGCQISVKILNFTLLWTETVFVNRLIIRENPHLNPVEYLQIILIPDICYNPDLYDCTVSVPSSPMKVELDNVTSNSVQAEILYGTIILPDESNIWTEIYIHQNTIETMLIKRVHIMSESKVCTYFRLTQYCDILHQECHRIVLLSIVLNSPVMVFSPHINGS